jgi:hypothetical protein
MRVDKFIGRSNDSKQENAVLASNQGSHQEAILQTLPGIIDVRRESGRDTEDEEICQTTVQGLPGNSFVS